MRARGECDAGNRSRSRNVKLLRLLLADHTEN
jgi:hypothetical protein